MHMGSICHSVLTLKHFCQKLFHFYIVSASTQGALPSKPDEPAQGAGTVDRKIFCVDAVGIGLCNTGDQEQITGDYLDGDLNKCYASGTQSANDHITEPTGKSVPHACIKVCCMMFTTDH